MNWIRCAMMVKCGGWHASRAPVMAGLVPAIHVFLNRGVVKTWMPGTRPGMTMSVVMVLALATPVRAEAQAPPPPVFSSGKTFAEQGGEALYARVCQGCHMADGRGAQGAGSYPALAGNDRLAASGYPLTVVLNGLRGMPPVGAMMSDQQVADVVNYVRGHFGNAYTDDVKPADVKAARPPDRIKSTRKEDRHEAQSQAGANRARHRYRPCCIYWEPPR